ncbi:hypothetical protein ON010_g2017 [Phytophthora cinnamomi]|nr:hypothetical protein ON010_g2017 [Phytophthora cinnamomi]
MHRYHQHHIHEKHDERRRRHLAGHAGYQPCRSRHKHPPDFSCGKFERSEGPIRCPDRAGATTSAGIISRSLSDRTKVAKRSFTTNNSGINDDQSTLDHTDFEAYQRERRRLNQERYRKRQKQRTISLERGNRQLRDEIERLRRQRNSGISTKGTMWSIALEYFRVFRRGLHILPELPTGAQIAELDILRGALAPDLDAGTVHGFELLVRNWMAFTLYFKDVHVQLKRLERITENSLLATTTSSITVTWHSLRHLFPHLTADSTDRRKRSRWPHIADKMLGARIVMRGSVRFDWSKADNRVIRLITQADMISPLLQLLGNLEDVLHVFQDALIRPDGNLVIGEHLKQFSLY